MQRILVITAFILLHSVLFLSCSGEKMEAKNMEQIYKEEGVPVKTQIILARLFEAYLSYNAVLTGIEESNAYASIGDRVEKILVNVGDYVEKDQVLLTFPTDNPAAQYYQAKVAFENAQKTYERMQNLFKTGGISQQDLDNAQAGFDVAKANWDAVRQSVKVKAPISGYVTKINVRESDNVDVENELFTISRISKLKAKVWISEKEILDVKKGQLAMASWNAIEIKGKVVQVDMALNVMTQAFGAVVEFDNPNNLIKPGVTVEVKITAYQNSMALVVERKNVLTDQKQHYVYITHEGYAQRRIITLGRQQGLEAEAVQGLSNGDELIVEGQMLLSDGSKIRVVQ